MEMNIHFKTLPRDMDLDELKRRLDEVLEDDGWLVGSRQGPEGGCVEMELEDERANPKHAIMAIRHFLHTAGFGPDTAMEVNGILVPLAG